jgi:hypothetical protein
MELRFHQQNQPSMIQNSISVLTSISDTEVTDRQKKYEPLHHDMFH